MEFQGSKGLVTRKANDCFIDRLADVTGVNDKVHNWRTLWSLTNLTELTNVVHCSL